MVMIPLAAAYAAMTLLQVGMALLAGYLLRAKMRGNPATRDADPQTYANRGAYVPLIVGRRRTGAVICWVGDRRRRRKRAEGSTKGGATQGSGQKVNVFYENAWHVLGIGPAEQIHGVWISGTYTEFPQGLSRSNYPSGTSLNLKGIGTCEIYWGEEDQDVNAYLGDVNRVGITSRWPLFCYVVWKDFKLGTAPRWPLIDYDLEVAPQKTYLGASPARNIRTTTFTGTAYDVIAQGLDASAPRNFWMEVAGAQALIDFPARSKYTYSGDGTLGTLVLTVFKTEVYPANVSSGGQVVVRIYSEEAYSPTVGTPPYGQVIGSGISQSGNYNPAHLLCQLLFDPFPHGLALDQDQIDLAYLEAFGATANNEGVTASVIAQDGEEAQTTIATLLQDFGVVMSWSPLRRKYVFKMIRPETNIPTLDEKHVLEGLPQIETLLKETPVDRTVYIFKDMDYSFKDRTISVDEDGQAGLYEVSRARQTPLRSIVDVFSAAKVAERRSQEDMAGGAAYSINASREARLLFPGQVLSVPGIRQLLRLISVSIDTISGQTQLECVTDYYGLEASTYVRSQPTGGTYFSNPADLNLAEDVLEAPALLHRNRNEDFVFPLWIRRHENVIGTAVWISRDDSTYTLLGLSENYVTGGELTSALAADTDVEIAEGPTLDLLGPDVDLIEDYSADDFNYNLGRQLLIIGDEVMFLRNVTALGGSSYRLDGIMRGRYGTEYGAHSIGDTVYILNVDNVDPFTDLLLEAGETIYFKLQPISGSFEVPLDAVTSFSKVLKGSGRSPIKPVNLGPSAWNPGECIPFNWDYFNREYPKTGAGEVLAGTPTYSVPPEGVFSLTFLTSGDVEVGSVQTSEPFYTLKNSDLVSIFGSEPTNFKVELRHIYGGRVSDAETLTVTRA